jgi:hypothetical protein
MPFITHDQRTVNDEVRIYGNPLRSDACPRAVEQEKEVRGRLAPWKSIHRVVDTPETEIVGAQRASIWRKSLWLD